MRIYVASPCGFSEVLREWHDGVLLPRIERMGHEALDPWTLVPFERIAAVAGMPAGEERVEAWRALNAEIADRNIEAVEACDMILAVLDGPDVDSGTASEIGYGFALGKIISGYRGDVRPGGGNEGCVVNLMIERFIERSGGSLVRTVADIDLAIYEAERRLIALRGIDRAVAKDVITRGAAE